MVILIHKIKVTKTETKTKSEDSNVKTDKTKHLTGTFSSKNGETVEVKLRLKMVN